MASQQHPKRPVDLADSRLSRFLQTFGRAFRRRCPYCGGRGAFANLSTLHKRCPSCGTLFAYEDGYFLGAYAVSLVFMIFFGIALVIGLIALTSLSVLHMQILGVVIVIALPILLYPLSLLIWIALDVTIHPPGDFSQRIRR
ncbi:MAG: hypothetical protein WKF81_03220 [Thermomicrobiales bacterium]